MNKNSGMYAYDTDPHIVSGRVGFSLPLPKNKLTIELRDAIMHKLTEDEIETIHDNLLGKLNNHTIPRETREAIALEFLINRTPFEQEERREK